MTRSREVLKFNNVYTCNTLTFLFTGICYEIPVDIAAQLTLMKYKIQA